ncbi:MAG: hypothetical protein MNPFHGCM_02016 [Gemmatimonadaceae bacterium]|nr:hypothetical protein [Gemmatimonadaceae bacterium]
MKKLVVTATALLVLAPMVGFAQNADPDKNVAGGVLVKGWTGRTDRANQSISNAKFADMGGGFHVTSGPAAIYWNPANVAKGNYAVKATFAQTKAPTHAEAYGLFIGGANLSGADQNYLYCIVRGDGKYMVKHRSGNETHTMAEWTDNAAVKKQDATGKATNELSLWASKDKIGCSVNGTEVWSMNRVDAVGPGKLTANGDIYGIRVNHNLDVHISNFAMSKM